MQTASESGYGPKVRYADAEKGIVVMDYLRPEEPPQADALLKAIADLLRGLHAGPSFPNAPAMFDQISGLVESLLQTRKGALSQEQAEKIVKALEEMRPLVECRPLAPCHRDLNPNNLLYSKDRLFAIDYETAAQDNPLFDLASIANFYRLGPSQEELFFSSYLQRAPTPEESAELYLMKQVVLLSFSLRLLAKIPPEALDPPPQLTSRQMLMLARPTAEDLKKPAYKYAIATLMLRAALQSFDSVNYRTALALLR